MRDFKQPWMLCANVDDLIEKYGIEMLKMDTPVFKVRGKDGKEYVHKMDAPIFKRVILEYLDLSIDPGNQLRAHYLGEEVKLPEYFLPAISNTDALVAEHLLIQAGCKCILNLEEFAAARSKIITYGRLAANGIRVPRTLVIFKHSDRDSIVKEMGFPFVIKPDNGYGGVGVELIHSREELDAYLDHQDPGVSYMAQEYISTSFGRDLRVVMLKGKYFYSATRNSNNTEEFRSNVHQGGSITECPIDDKVLALCEKAAGLFDLPLLGLDLLFGDGEYVIVEVNAMPGLDNARTEQVHRVILDDFLEKEKNQ